MTRLDYAFLFTLVGYAISRIQNSPLAWGALAMIVAIYLIKEDKK